MIKQKAPKDMTATEFVGHLELVASREMLAKNLEGWAITLQGLRKELSEPAPNPFTDDQLAWMREMQRMGFNYATQEGSQGFCYIYERNPKTDLGYFSRVGRLSFLSKCLVADDPEPMCFADYAPLEEKINE